MLNTSSRIQYAELPFLTKVTSVIPLRTALHQALMIRAHHFMLSQLVVSNPLGAGKPTPSLFDFSAKECYKPDPSHQTTVPGICPNSPKDEQGESRDRHWKDFTPPSLRTKTTST
ncbi:hypothetical protein TNCV_708731 [Trichonephila clavipes]|nr:hypothetical protein TNCV_708731 [Trichonephila clavipes]